MPAAKPDSLSSDTITFIQAGHLGKEFHVAAAAAAVLTTLFGIVALVGWLLDVYSLKAVFSMWGTVKLSVAVGFIFAGVGLWLLRWPDAAPRLRQLGQFSAAMTVLVGAFTLSEYALGFDMQLERAFYPGGAEDANSSPVGRMAPASAVCFLLGGLSLLLLDRPFRSHHAAQYLGVTIQFIALIAFLGYAFGAEAVYSWLSSTKMALPTALGFLIFGLGLILCRPGVGLMATATSTTGAGVLSRRLLPEAILVLILVSWLTLKGQQAGLYNMEFGLLLQVLVSLVSLVSLIAWSAWSLRQQELKRARAEDALQKTEERFRLLVEGVQDYAIFMLEPDGRVASWTAAAERTFGYGAAEILGQHFSCFFTHQDLDDGKPQRELSRARREGRCRDENWLVRQDGSRFWASVVVTALHDSVGNLRGFGEVVRDITERRQAEERARGMNLELERRVTERTAELTRSNAELEQFAYVAAHDLQEPLRKVISYTQLLQELYQGKLDADADEFIHFAVDGAQRMQRLIQDLLAYSRVGRKGNPPALVPLETVLRTALENLQGALEESGAVVTFDALPTLVVEEALLVQLFQNLLGNAVKFRGPEPPQVHVSAARSGKEWLFSIKDNGIGIDPQYAEKIFVIFQRLHSRSEYPGTGIGLAICKKIVERHRGRIWVESRSGQGSTFYFTFPDTTGRLGEEPADERTVHAQTQRDLARR